jgi:hypothetical protein
VSPGPPPAASPPAPRKTWRSRRRVAAASSCFCAVITAVAIGLAVGLTRPGPAAPFLLATTVTATLAIPGMTCGAMQYNAGGVETALLGAVAAAAGVANSTAQPLYCVGVGVNASAQRRVLQANYVNSCAAMAATQRGSTVLMTTAISCLGTTPACGVAAAASLAANMYASSSTANSTLSYVFARLADCTGAAASPAFAIAGVPPPAVNASVPAAAAGGVTTVSPSPSFVFSTTPTAAASASVTRSASPSGSTSASATVAASTSPTASRSATPSATPTTAGTATSSPSATSDVTPGRSRSTAAPGAT